MEFPQGRCLLSPWLDGRSQAVLPDCLPDFKDLWLFQKDIPIDEINSADVIDIKDIKIDLVIINEEPNSYDSYLKYEIEDAIINKQLAYLKNIFGGIFTICKNEIDLEDIDLLKFKASVFLKAESGSLETAITDLEEEYLKTIKNIGIEENEPTVETE